MEETLQQASQEDKPKLSKEQRSQIMSEAAKRRWAKIKRAGKSAKGKTPAKGKVAAKSAKSKPKAAPQPRMVSVAVKTAEKRLAEAIDARSTHLREYSYHYGLFSAADRDIPSLVTLIQTLNNPSGTVPGYINGPAQAPTMEMIMGDQPLQYQPSRPPAQYTPPSVPVIPVPQKLHPANTTGRAGGGAVGGQLQEEQEGEDQFLNDSNVSGGQWR